MRARTLLAGTSILSALLFPGLASAISIGFSPSSQAVDVGDTVSVELTITGLGNLAPASLGVFDLDVLFDPTVLAPSGVVFGDPVLGDQLDLFALGSLTASDDSTPGILNLFELSLDSASDLDSLQAGSFTLATLDFTAVSLGSSALDATIHALGDAFGDRLVADVTPGSISPIPEPSGLVTFLTGLIVVVGAMRRSASSHGA